MGKSILNSDTLKLANFLPFKNPNTLKWLYAPSKEAIYFSLRTILASFLAVAISLWMELDSPRWALMTVWITAQTTSGETIIKAQSRVAGTIVGVIAGIILPALFPQQPVLFYIGLALWVGACAWLGSLVRSATNYGYVLAGYTCALVGLTVTSNPNAVFMMGMARGSYIILGVLCLSVVERFFAVSMNQKSKKTLYNNLDTAVTGSLAIAVDVLKGDEQAASRVQKVFMAVSAFQSSLEFRKVELLHDTDHTVDHVHAALSSVSLVLTRLTHLNVCLQNLPKDEVYQKISLEISTYLEQLTASLDQKDKFDDQLKILNTLRWECRQIITDYVYYDSIAQSEDGEKDQVSLLDHRILYRALSGLLAEIEKLLTQYQAAHNPPKADKFRFKSAPMYNFKVAWGNALRTLIVVLFGCFLWEITAWDQFPTIIGLFCVACGRLSVFENGYMMCVGVYKGALWGCVAAGILNMTLLAQASTIEMLCLSLFIPLFIGGLMNYNLSTRAIGLGYSVFFPYVLIWGNQAKINEIQYFNTSLAMIVGVGMCTFAFYFIFPYSPPKVRQQIRHRLVNSIRSLAKITQLPNPRRWVLSTMEWFVYLMRQFNAAKDAALLQQYNHGAVGVMSIGLNMLQIRKMIDHDVLSENIKNELRDVMQHIADFGGERYEKTLVVTKEAIQRLREHEATEENLARRLEIGVAVACLMFIYHSLEKNIEFLNLSA